MTAKTITVVEEANTERVEEQQDGCKTGGQKAYGKKAIHVESQRNKSPESDDRWHKVKIRRGDKQDEETLEAVVRVNGTTNPTKALTSVKKVIAANANEIEQFKRIIATKSGKVVLIATRNEKVVLIPDHEQAVVAKNAIIANEDIRLVEQQTFFTITGIWRLWRWRTD